jgi:hypothetical protein
MKLLSTIIDNTITPLLVSGMMMISPIAVGQIDDDFNTSNNNWKDIGTEEGWNVNHLNNIDVNTTDYNCLNMKPSTSMWYNSYMGPFCFQNVSGDFVFTTLVKFTGANGVSSIGQNSHYSLGGIMIRTPKNFNNGLTGWVAGKENYVSLMVGYGDNNGPCTPGQGTHIMVNNTVNSVSNMCQTLGNGDELELRIARIGDVIILMSRPKNGSWNVINRMVRSDFPIDMQIGFACMTDLDKAYTYSTSFANSHNLNSNLSPDPSTNFMQPFNADLSLSFDYGKFNKVNIPSSLIGVDLINSATDFDILSFLSFDVSAMQTGINDDIKNEYDIKTYYSDNKIKVVNKKGLYGSIIIVDIVGKVKYQSELNGDDISISCDNWNDGIYFVKYRKSTYKIFVLSNPTVSWVIKD